MMNFSSTLSPARTRMRRSPSTSTATGAFGTPRVPVNRNGIAGGLGGGGGGGGSFGPTNRGSPGPMSGGGGGGGGGGGFSLKRKRSREESAILTGGAEKASASTSGTSSGEIFVSRFFPNDDGRTLSGSRFAVPPGGRTGFLSEGPERSSNR